MQFSATLAIAGLLVSQVLAQTHTHSPSDKAAHSWDEGAVHEYPIHASCNATERPQLQQALAEAIALAEHARRHVLRWGNESALYRRYFGNQPTGEVIGNFDIIANGDKGGVLFRCDNPDGNCALKNYGGHWRGENGTDETVICPRSYETRRPLVQICAFGYNVAEYPTNTYFASDLLHRLYHMPSIGEYHVEHYTETYSDVIEMAKNNASYSTHDSDTLQYFALDVYAYDIAIPGVGCSGPVPDSHEVTSSSAVHSSSSAHAETTSPIPAPTTLVTVASPVVEATTTEAEAVSVTSGIPPGCHTHADGALHCE